MNIKDMTKESLAALLESLVEQGKVSDKDIISAAVTTPTDEMKGIVDMVHSFMCNRQHGDNPGQCDYYIEDNLFECWQLGTHKMWLQEVGLLMKEFNIVSIKDLTASIQSVASVIQTLSELRSISVPRYHLAANILSSFLSVELAKLNPQSGDILPSHLLA